MLSKAKKKSIRLIFVSSLMVWASLGLLFAAIDATCKLLNSQNSYSVFLGAGGVVVCIMIPTICGSMIYEYSMIKIEEISSLLKKEKKNEQT